MDRENQNKNGPARKRQRRDGPSTQRAPLGILDNNAQPSGTLCGDSYAANRSTMAARPIDTSPLYEYQEIYFPELDEETPTGAEWIRGTAEEGDIRDFIQELEAISVDTDRGLFVHHGVDASEEAEVEADREEEEEEEEEEERHRSNRIESSRGPGILPDTESLNFVPLSEAPNISGSVILDGLNEVQRGASVRQIPVFNACEFRQPINFRHIQPDNPEQIPAHMRDMLSNVIDSALSNSTQGCVLNAVLRGPSLANDVQAILNQDNDYNVDLFLDQIASVMQSNDDSISDDDLEFVISVAQDRSGGVRLKLGNVPYDEILSKKAQHLFNPNNRIEDNQLCFSLCITQFLSPNQSQAEKIQYAKRLHNTVGLQHTDQVALSDVSKFEKLLGVKIIVFHHGVGRKRLQCFQTSESYNPVTIWLYLHDNHYYLIENATGFFGCAYVCKYCYTGYAAALHSCKHLCNVCFTHCHQFQGRTIKCESCKRICKSQTCFQNHKLPDPVHQKVPCDVIKYCEGCGKMIKRLTKTQHICTGHRCTHCGALKLDESHQCFIQPLERKNPVENYIFFDFETRTHCNKHEANFVCAMDMAGKRFCFNTLKCVDAFIKYYRRPKFSGYTFMAHNASGFDMYLVLNHFVKLGLAPSITMRGTRVIQMFDSAYNQRWIDSFSFLPMRLSKTPAAMGFEDLEKGFFPHRFNTRENENYVGAYPAPSFYDYDKMSDGDKLKFMAWYESVRHGVFDLQAELRRYCVNDVEVLRKACTVYRTAFLASTQMDPFAFPTLASSCMGVFKTLFLPKDTLALTYDGAYVEQNKTYSNASIQWLEYMAHKEGCMIRHALKGGEQQVGRFFVDGFRAETRTCYEYAGCLHHGCPICHVPTDLNPLNKTPYGELYQAFLDRIDVLKTRHGMHVVVMWECEWGFLTESDPDVVSFLSTYRKPERLDPRKALFGGRTNALKMYHQVVGGERISYYDFTSLYPTVQARKEYPVGHPQVIFQNFDSVDKYFGFVKCTVLPPRGLYHPVLPYRCHNKLMFPLCGRCAEELNQSDSCVHGERDRQLAGTWVSFELQKALEKGYQILSIDEVWHFPNKTDTLFKEYVKTFLKCKQEASGYPKHVKTPEQQQKYIADYYEREGILLDPAKIRVNKAVRNCNKLLLNSLWGRFSMRTNLSSCELITEPERFTQLMFSPEYAVTQFCFISDDVAMVQWRYADGRASRVRDVNVFIGAMTTAYARLMLYDLLDRLQERVLYCDTDSVVFISRPGDWIPPLGPYLGDLTDELNDDEAPGEDFITEFVSGGPKCYAYHTHHGKSVVKCKGVTLNHVNSNNITQKSLKGLVQAFVTNQNTDSHITAVSDTIKRDKKRFHLTNASVVKKVRVVYNKRRVLSDYTTLPYGY